MLFITKSEKNMLLLLPGHTVLQVLFCTDMPSQKAPPLRGAGFVQVRERFCTPRPQRTLQGDQSVQDDQPPFTARVRRGGKRYEETLKEFWPASQSEDSLKGGNEHQKKKINSVFPSVNVHLFLGYVS